MKIGINARFLAHPYTGIGQYTINLLQALGEADHENEYFLYTPKLVDLPLPDNFHQVRVPEKEYRSPSLRKFHWEHILVPQEMMKAQIDLAHFLYPANPKKKMPFPMVVTIHDVIPWALPFYRKRFRSKLYYFYTRQALKKADHIITVSEFSKNEIERILKLKAKNISVIPLAPPLNQEKALPSNVPLRRKFLLYVGGYDARKNVPYLMDAFQKHIANHYAVDLILVGGKDHHLDPLITDRYCERVAGQYPVKPKGNIIFTDPLPPEELNSLYKHALALVHVSRYEGFNLPLVEAMSNGLPIIAADIPVNHEVTAEHALFVDPTSIDAIGTGMHAFLNDRSLQKSLAEKGRERARDFNWQKSAEDTLYVYNLFS